MADARGEYWYYEPNIDINKITVPELRSILLKHNVTYPASAKKAVLLSLFSDHVLPQATKLQRAYSRTKRSTRGIEDVSSSAASTVTDDPGDDTLLAPESTTRRTSRRNTVPIKAEPADQPVPAQRSKTPSRPSANYVTEPHAPINIRSSIRGSRESNQLVTENSPPDSGARHTSDVASPFTQDNPFQSGSSPTMPEARDNRRRTMAFEHREKRKSDAGRRKTIQPKLERSSQESSDAFDKLPDRRVLRTHHNHEDQEGLEVQTGEEFSPEEQLELVRERAKNGEVDILPPRRRARPSKAVNTVKAFSLTLITTILATFGGLWRQGKLEVGYCGVGNDHLTNLGGLNIPEFANALVPQCESCPPHATCYPHLQITCDPDFVKREHPLSFGGLVPLPPTCEADTEKTRRVRQVADLTVQILRQRRADFECKLPDTEGNIVQSPEVNVAELKQDLLSVKRKSISNEAFEELFAKAIGDAAQRDEVTETTDGKAGERHFSSNSLAKLPLVCSIHRSLRESVERHLLTIAMILLVTVSALYGRYYVRTDRSMESRAKQLASDVFDRLANQAALAQQEPTIYQDRGLSMNQLRDDVLRHEFSASRRLKLWQRVQKKVEHNSNVRAAVREGYSGDVTRMWEWTGPVQLIEDGRGSGRRDGGQSSLGWGSSPAEPRSAKEVSRWEEGHPIY